MFTSILNNRLKAYSDKYNVIDSCQARFRNHHSTADNIFIIKCLIDIARAYKSKLFSCLIDFKQAFDTVWSNGLWHKLLAGSVCCFLEQETFTPQKVLVIPRNRWLRLNMTEKLFTGTLNKNQKKKKKKKNKRKMSGSYKKYI